MNMLSVKFLEEKKEVLLYTKGSDPHVWISLDRTGLDGRHILDHGDRCSHEQPMRRKKTGECLSLKKGQSLSDFAREYYTRDGSYKLFNNCTDGPLIVITPL